MKILVLGAGGIGGYFGGRLAEQGADVTFLVRERRRAQLARDGLRIESVYGDATIPVATVSQDELQPQYDVILLTSKAYDLPSAIEAVRGGCRAGTAILPLLNGVAHIEVLNQAFGAANVLGGTAKIAVTLTPEGVVKHLNDWRFITFGEQNGEMTPRITALKQAFDRTSVQARAVPNIMQEMWEKVTHLTTVAGMTCLMRANVGEIVRTPDGQALLLRFLEANAAISAKAGHAPGEEFMASYRKLFSDADSTYTASMLRDLEKGGQIEGDHILGFMLAKAREFGIDDTLHAAAYTHVKAYEQRRDAGRL